MIRALLEVYSDYLIISSSQTTVQPPLFGPVSKLV